MSDLGIVVILVVIGFVCGRWAEQSHFASIRKREQELQDIILVPSKKLPTNWVCETAFVSGSVVIGMDYFKKTFALLSFFLGGRVRAYETLVERARREAVLRMKEETALMRGKYIFNIKFSTANLMGQDVNKSGCVEVTAYGTAIILHH